MRTPQEDVGLLVAAGVWGEGDRLMNAVMLLVMYGKRRHKPFVNLHKLANAVEKGDAKASRKYVDRLAREVEQTLRHYPDIVGTLDTMAEMNPEDLEQIDRAMSEIADIDPSSLQPIDPADEEEHVIWLIADDVLETLRLAAEQQGGPTVFPNWLIDELVYELTCGAASLGDAKLDAGRRAGYDSGAADEAAHQRYTVELRRALEEHGVEDVADRARQLVFDQLRGEQPPLLDKSPQAPTQ